MKIIKCKCCGKEKEIEQNHNIGDLLDIGWNFVCDVSNGLTTIKVCDECSKKIQFHIRALEDIMKMPFWKLHFNAEEKRYE